MKIALDKIIELITREVIKELVNQGYHIDDLLSDDGEYKSNTKKSIEIDMSGFVTPIVTEGSIENLDKDVKEVIIPTQTVITPGADRLVKQREIKLIYKS